MVWLVLALMGYAALRLHAAFQPIPIWMTSVLGVNVYRRVILSLTGLSLFGIAFFYNLPPSTLLWYHQSWSVPIACLMMLCACYATITLVHPSNASRYVSIPTCLILMWAGSHVLVNGDTTSVLVFSSFFIVAMLEFVLGLTQSSQENVNVVPLVNEISVFAIALLLCGLLYYSHVYYAGVPIIW